MYKVRRVVEGPMEFDIFGVGHNITKDINHLSFANTMNYRLGAFANRHI
jgi:hypothetical protein